MRPNDFKDAEGNVDWPALRRAEVAHGDICERCGRYRTGKGHREQCADCEALTRGVGEVHHHRLVRCPKCCAIWAPDDLGSTQQVYRDGEHEVWCAECDHRFDISTDVTFTFTSPAILPHPQQKEGNGDV